MSSLRDEIARAVARAVDRALDGERAMTPPPLGDWHPLVTDAADDILARVREALLAKKPVDEIAYQLLWAERGTGVENGVLLHPTAKQEVQARMAMIAAFDAVAGEGGER